MGSPWDGTWNVRLLSTDGAFTEIATGQIVIQTRPSPLGEFWFIVGDESEVSLTGENDLRVKSGLESYPVFPHFAPVVDNDGNFGSSLGMFDNNQVSSNRIFSGPGSVDSGGEKIAVFVLGIEA